MNRIGQRDYCDEPSSEKMPVSHDCLIPINKFIRVENINSRGFGVLPPYYKNNKIGYNCYKLMHDSTTDEYQTGLFFMPDNKPDKYGKVFSPLPKSFHLDKKTGQIYSDKVPRDIFTYDIETQRIGHSTYHQCYIIYCNNAGCIVDQINFQILPPIPFYNIRNIKFQDDDKTPQKLSGLILYGTDVADKNEYVQYNEMTGYQDTNHYNVYIDDGYNLDYSQRLLQAVLLWNSKSIHNHKWEIQIKNGESSSKHYRRGYRFMVIISCSTFTCATQGYQLNQTVMKLDNNKYFETTNVIEFFDYGFKPFYFVKNVYFPVDSDGDKNQLSGWVYFEPPTLNEHTFYKLYLGMCKNCRDFLIETGIWGNEKILININTPIRGTKYVIVVTANEIGENDMNPYFPFTDEFFECTQWHPCMKDCMLNKSDVMEEYEKYNNAKYDPTKGFHIDDLIPWQYCNDPIYHFIWQQCHLHICPMKQIKFWPSMSNYNGSLDFQISTSRAYTTSLLNHNKPGDHNENNAYLYQHFKFVQSKSDIKVWIYKDKNTCSDILNHTQCLILVRSHQCLTDPLNILPLCKKSCGACTSQYHITDIPSPPNHQSFWNDFEVSLPSNVLWKTFFVRDIFVIDQQQTQKISNDSDTVKLSNKDVLQMSKDYLISIKNNGFYNIDDDSSSFEIDIRRLDKNLPWNENLKLFYIIDINKPYFKHIPWILWNRERTLYTLGDAYGKPEEEIVEVEKFWSLLNLTQWRDYTNQSNINYTKFDNTDEIPFQDMIESLQFNDEDDNDLRNGLIRVEIEAFYYPAYSTDVSLPMIGYACQWTNESDWRLNSKACGPVKYTLFQTIVNMNKLPLPCLTYTAEYDNYDRWIRESFTPKFTHETSPSYNYYTIFDENPHNTFGEVTFHVACPLTIQHYDGLKFKLNILIGIENQWKEWIPGGPDSYPKNSDSWTFKRLHPSNGQQIEEQLRRLVFFSSGFDQLVPKDERMPIVKNITIRIFDEQDLFYSQMIILRIMRLPDYETITPKLISPQRGDVVQTGFRIRYLLREDPFANSVEIKVYPRQSQRYPTDTSSYRTIILNDDSKYVIPNIVHSLKFDSKLDRAQHTMQSVISAIFPQKNLLEFSLYDFSISYKDKWNNPTKEDKQIEVMVVRDWTEDFYVLTVIYDTLNGRNWLIKWDIHQSNLCNNYGVTCNELNQVTHLKLFANNLTGAFPNEIGKLSSLKMLDFGGNYVTGTLPNTLQLLTMLTHFSVSSNSMYGNLPQGLENLKQLETINLSGNMFSGTINNGMILLGLESKYLKNLFLNANFFTGQLPKRLKDFPTLEMLYLDGNKFYCEMNYDTIIDYSQWAKIQTDYSSINSCQQRPLEMSQLDVFPPDRLI